jgi:hypothetical protein
MKSLSLVLAALVGLAALPASSQQLQQPVVPTAKPATPPSNTGVGPALNQPQSAPAPKVASDPNQRPQAPTAVPSTGPAREVPTQSKAAAARKQPAVLDANGKPINGMIQVAPNRVVDPATGRYHWTEPSGDQQKVLD